VWAPKKGASAGQKAPAHLCRPHRAAPACCPLLQITSQPAPLQTSHSAPLPSLPFERDQQAPAQGRPSWQASAGPELDVPAAAQQDSWGQLGPLPQNWLADTAVCTVPAPYHPSGQPHHHEHYQHYQHQHHQRHHYQPQAAGMRYPAPSYRPGSARAHTPGAGPAGGPGSSSQSSSGRLAPRANGLQQVQQPPSMMHSGLQLHKQQQQQQQHPPLHHQLQQMSLQHRQHRQYQQHHHQHHGYQPHQFYQQQC
jgi:hypothetical protein